MENENTQKYTNFLNQIISQKLVWLLKASDGMYAMFEDNSNRSYLPVWATKNDAQGQSVDDWSDYEPESMEIYEFINWMQELKDDEIIIGLSPDNSLQSMAVDPLEFKNNLIAALKS